MDATTATRLTTAPGRWQRTALEWWPVLLGLLALYVPTMLDLSQSLWTSEDQAHGPIILIVMLGLFWQQRQWLLTAAPATTRPVSGTLCLLLGLLLYALGRSQQIYIFQIGSMVPVLAGVLLITRGGSALRACWFPLFFALFMVPLPGAVIDAATGPLKQLISAIAENGLYHAGYPIGRSGVTIMIGRYQLLVADACSGLHSMFSLSALGSLYLYMMQYRNWRRNGVLLLSILPIAFVANVVRVIALILVTYHFGDAAGQGFIHGAAGMSLFVIALLLLFLLDSLLGRFRRFRDDPVTPDNTEKTA